MIRRRRRRRPDRAGPWIGVAGLFVLLWISISTFLYAPWWAAVLVIALVVPQGLLVRRWVTARPRWCPYVPAVGVVVWFALVLAGARWWGWSA